MLSIVKSYVQPISSVQALGEFDFDEMDFAAAGPLDQAMASIFDATSDVVIGAAVETLLAHSMTAPSLAAADSAIEQALHNQLEGALAVPGPRGEKLTRAAKVIAACWRFASPETRGAAVVAVWRRADRARWRVWGTDELRLAA